MCKDKNKDKKTKRKRYDKFENERKKTKNDDTKNDETKDNNENENNNTTLSDLEKIIIHYIPTPPPNIYSDEDDNILEEDEAYYNNDYINIDLKDIDDLINLGKRFNENEFSYYTKYNINLRKLGRLVEPLIKLQKMIGMENVKEEVFNLLLYQLQDFDNSKDMLHTIIEGEPGVGKTEVAKILGEIYQSMGYCTNHIIKFVKRSDLIGGYLGQTAIKTQKVLDQCKGGILIIDEAYSLGAPDRTDSYSKECIDTLTRFLSESPDTIVFIMGYKEALNDCLFKHNRGLERRFSYRFSIHKYTHTQLKEILFKIIRENEWFIDNKDEIPDSFFENNRDYFKFNGGDMLNLFTKCKFTHSIRFFNLNKTSNEEKNHDNKKKCINFEDIENAFKLLLKDVNYANRKKIDDTNHHFMYS